LLGYKFLTSTHQDFSNGSVGEKIICFGDSLTHGTGASRGKDYPSQLSKMISRPVINAGVPGDTTARALQRLERDVLSYSPDLVLVTWRRVRRSLSAGCIFHLEIAVLEGAIKNWPMRPAPH